MALFALWLADYQLLAAALLLGVMLALAALRQPAQRLAVAKSTLAALAALALLCALPGWSLVHLLSDGATIAEPTANSAAPAPAFSATLSTIEPTPDLFNAQPPESPAGGVLHTDSRNKVEPAHPISWSAYLVAAYGAGSAAVTLWLITGALLARRVCQQATPAPRELQELLQQLCAPEKTPPHLLLSDRITAPVALSLRRPTILLPTSTFPLQHSPFPISPSQLLPILAHELAHLQHRDLHTLAATRLLLILLWPQPLYWLLRRTIRLDQETLADAAAADRAGRLDYAQQLLVWASSASTQRPPRLAGAVGLWEGPSQLKRRIAVLLNEKFNVMRSCSRRWRSGSLVAIALLAIGLSTVTFQPQVGAANDADAEELEAESPADEKVASTTESPVAATAPADTAAEEDPMIAYLGHRETDNKTPNVIRGRCLDEANRPIADVEVELYSGKRPSGMQQLVTQTKTSVTGEFEFRHLVDPKSFPDGMVPASHVSNTEMFTVITRQTGRVSRDVIADAQYTYREGRAVDILMPPAAVLTGTIKDEAGKPIAGARVSKNLMSDFPHVFSATTDSEGRFSINDLAPFDLEAEKKRQEEQKKGTDAQLAAGANAVLSFSLAPRFTVVHPEFASVRLPLSSVPGNVDATLSPGGRLPGRVIFADGSPAANAMVTVKPSIPKRGNGDWGMIDYGKFKIDRDYQVTVQTDAAGRFEADSLTPGKVDVWAELPGWLNAGIGEFEVKAGPAASLPDLTLTRGGVIRLQLIDDDTGRPITVDQPLAAEVSVTMKNKLGRGDTWPEQKKVSDKGVVEIASLPGTAQVMLQSIEAGAEPQWLPAANDWTAYPQAQVVEGEAVDAKIRVRKTPAARAATTKDASAGIKPAAETRHQTMGQGAFVSVPLEPQDPSTENANKLAIAVVDEQGAPLPGVEALIYRVSRPQGEQVLDRTVATDADGKFVADNLVAPAEVERFEKIKAAGGFINDGSKGGYVIALRRPGLATALLFQSPGDLALYGANRTIKMRPAVKLSGQVTDQVGKPVTGAQVIAGDSFVGGFAIDGVNATITDAEGRYEFADRAPFNRAESNKKQNQFLAASASLHFQAARLAKESAPAEDPSVNGVSNLLVSHPDYAVTRVEGGDVPGVADVQLLPPASISGRVVQHGSGAPAAGVTVHAAGFPDASKGASIEMRIRSGHSAVATTDATGAYRFSNLPAARYDVWADSGAQEMSDAPWVSRGQSRIEALPGGEPAKVPDLIIGPPAIVQVQLVDAESGEPVELPAGATANLASQRVDGPSMQQPPLQRVLTTTDGKFDMRLFPGRSRVLLFIHEGAVGSPAIW